jgi:hypothetical protein
MQALVRVVKAVLPYSNNRFLMELCVSGNMRGSFDLPSAIAEEDELLEDALTNHFRCAFGRYLNRQLLSFIGQTHETVSDELQEINYFLVQPHDMYCGLFPDNVQLNKVRRILPISLDCKEYTGHNWQLFQV